MRTKAFIPDFFDEVLSCVTTSPVWTGSPTGDITTGSIIGPWNVGETHTAYPETVTATVPWDRVSTHTTIDDLVHRIGTPWDSAPTFPPFNVDVNKASGDIRCTFALSGIDSETVNIEFGDGKMWLIIEEQPEQESDWEPLRHKIKGSVAGKYFYRLDLEKYDYQKALAEWRDGLLTVTVPVREDKKPLRLSIKRK